MTKVHPGRYTADVSEDGVVVFVIGMRINKLRKLRTWMPVARAMGPMIEELVSHPDKGMLGVEQSRQGRLFLLVQYWRSFEHLERFARATDDLHLPAWREFNRLVGTSGDVGIFHETYVVPAGGIECIYNNMPDYGLAKAVGRVAVAKRGQAAAYRMGRAKTDEPAEPVPA
ncbi:MAG TPA: DUF4188 domain-containing protein [Acidimicrobiales bacterium]